MGGALSEPESPWPVRLPEGAVLQAHVREVSGSESWWRLLAAPAGYAWERTERDGDRWATTAVGPPWPDALDAVVANDSVHAGPGRTVDMTVAEDLLTGIARAITPPHVPAEEGVGWPEETVERWTKYRNWLTVDIPHKEVWARINRAELLIYTPEGTSGEWPVLYLWNEDRFLGLRVLAESSWSSESGGAPVSWDGGSRLSELFPGMLLSEAWGDLRQESRVLPAAGVSAIGRAIADFVLEDRQQFMAAWDLEDFGSQGPITSEARSEWLRAVEEIPLSLTMSFHSEEVRAACRQHLRQDNNYSWFAEAIRTPDSEIGRNLLALLREVVENGMTGALMSDDL